MLDNYKVLYMDLKTTTMDNNAKLISVAVLSEEGDYFHAENSDITEGDKTTWVKDNIEFIADEDSAQIRYSGNNSIDFYGREDLISVVFSRWLQSIKRPSEKVVLVTDRHAHTWYHFCKLWGGYDRMPNYFAEWPIDLSTALFMRGVDPEISRFTYVDTERPTRVTSLLTCKIIKMCYHKVIGKH